MQHAINVTVNIIVLELTASLAFFFFLHKMTKTGTHALSTLEMEKNHLIDAGN